MPERRPIRARSHPASVALASALARARIAPNAISIAGMLAALAAGALLAATAHLSAPAAERAAWLLAAILIPLRLACNMLDGMVAISTGRSSPLGELFNEVPDRISDAAVLIGLGSASTASPALGLAAALLAVFTAYVRAAAALAGAPQDFRGPMAKPHRMALVCVCALVMGSVPSPRRFPIGRHAPSLPDLVLLIISIGCILTAARRLVRAAACLRSRAR